MNFISTHFDIHHFLPYRSWLENTKNVQPLVVIRNIEFPLTESPLGSPVGQMKQSQMRCPYLSLSPCLTGGFRPYHVRGLNLESMNGRLQITCLIFLKICEFWRDVKNKITVFPCTLFDMKMTYDEMNSPLPVYVCFIGYATGK